MGTHVWQEEVLGLAIAAIANSAILEFSAADPALRRELLIEPFRFRQSWVTVPTKPGSGIEIG
jgi:L-alanine-DL-glutamate epimerase-like enolase superfamily enzyme